MKCLIDMNISPVWEDYLLKHGIDATHWIKVGSPKSIDQEILKYAKHNGFIIFTNDLDFGAILAATNALAPSVIQIRTQDLTTEAIGEQLLRCLNQFKVELEVGCILTLDTKKAKVRLLPLNPL